ncbi:metalloregulator ArsR/SmtB family transcription factor [Blastococcus sp. Marseille-P5729]|uniref:helix-turn-helix transcriptional regulator n=1 Tax=Blastococcus sp. Marseille-P5729 TaxID=2086582 RepID=UPI000D10683D|nr:helix-turn-helix domain-containing protein [Blastococcus sp. Marseille-P5729]
MTPAKAARLEVSMDEYLLDSGVRRRIVDELSSQPDRALTASEFAGLLGLHTSTARFHLNRLVAAGVLVARDERRGVGRPRKMYLLAPPAPESPAQGEIHPMGLLTELLARMVRPEPGSRPMTPDEAGESWAHQHVPASGTDAPAKTPGEWISKIGGLTDVLNYWGYTSAITANGDGGKAEIRITHCPIRELARENIEVVCGIHRGLIRGTMQQLGEPRTDVELLPFADGDVCIAHLYNQELPGHESKES